MMSLSLFVLWAWLGTYPALHADAMTLSEVWLGIQHGQGVGSWLFSGACSLFPDLGATALASCWTQDLAGWQRWHGFFIGAGVAWGAARLMRQQWDLNPWQARAFAAAGLILGLVLCQPLGFGALFSPGHHGWSCVMALWAWAWVLRQEQRPSSWGYSLFLAVVWGLTWASDGMFAVWGLLPVLFLALLQSSWPRNRIIVSFVFAWLVKKVALNRLEATGAKVGVFRWSYAQAHAAQLWQGFQQGLPGLLHGEAPFLIAGLLSLLLWTWLAWKRSQGWRILAAWALAAVCNGLLCVLIGSAPRYVLFPCWSLVLFAPAICARVFTREGSWSLLAPVLAGLLWLAPLHAPAEPALELREAAWLDQAMFSRGLSQGWSDYFHSRPLRLFSHAGLQVLPMISQAPDHVDPHLWVVDRRLFPDGLALARPQFVVMNGLDAGAIMARLGQPKERLQGEGLDVWVYGAVPAKKEHA
jgi:hypothetical protein